jgi:hypothetical protein
MTKSDMERMCAEWITEHLDPEDKEGLAAFQAWMERGANDPGRCLTVEEAVAAWQRLVEQRKMH